MNSFINSPLLATIINILALIIIIVDLKKYLKKGIRKGTLFLLIISDLCILSSMLLYLYMAYNPVDISNIKQVMYRLTIQEIPSILFGICVFLRFPMLLKEKK